MKKILFVLVFVLSSCYWSNDLTPDSQITYQSDEYYWYYNNSIFKGVDSCQVVGVLKNKFTDDMRQINHKCAISNDTIYIIKKYIAKENNIFDGVFYIRGDDPYRIIIELK